MLIPSRRDGDSLRTEIIDTSCASSFPHLPLFHGIPRIMIINVLFYILAKPADSHKVDEEIKRADFVRLLSFPVKSFLLPSSSQVCIAYDVNRPETLANVTKEWIPRILRLKARVPSLLLSLPFS